MDISQPEDSERTEPQSIAPVRTMGGKPARFRRASICESEIAEVQLLSADSVDGGDVFGIVMVSSPMTYHVGA